MIRAFQFEWHSGTRFTFNCYQHWSTLVIRNTGGGQFPQTKEGVTQGEPLAMILYSIGILPLIRKLQAAHPLVK